MKNVEISTPQKLLTEPEETENNLTRTPTLHKRASMMVIPFR